MRRPAPVFLVLFVLTFAFTTAVRSAAQPADTTARAPRIGLALSGGGAKGFAHIGVLKVLEEVGLPVDVVTGTSMGSVVGGLYAMGYDAADLLDIASRYDWEEMFTDAPNRTDRRPDRLPMSERMILNLPLQGRKVELPTELVSGQRLTTLLSRLTLPVHDVRDFSRLPIPFACVATDIETGEAVRLETGFLARAIRASMAIPSVLSPIEIDGRTLIDGGVARNLPASDARDLGADAVVCVDASGPLQPADSLDSLLDIMMQAVSFQIREEIEQQYEYCDVVIVPDVRGTTTFDFGRSASMIARGEEAARAELPALETLRDRAGPRPPRPPRDTLGASIRVADVRIDGLARELAEHLRILFDIEPPIDLTPDALDARVALGYTTQLLERLGYRLESAPEDSGYVLVFDGAPRNHDRLGVGLRYDSRYRASLLFNAHFQQYLLAPAGVDLYARLGQTLQLGLGLEMPSARFRRLVYRAAAHATRTPLELFEGGLRQTELRTEMLGASAGLALRTGDWTFLDLDVLAERFRLSRSVGTVDEIDRRGTLVGLSAVLDHHAFDRSPFATRGHDLRLLSRVYTLDFAHLFTRHVLTWSARWPMGEALALRTGLAAGHHFGTELPLHQRFLVGGSFDYPAFEERQFLLHGHEVQELTGRSLQLLRLGVQYRLTPSSLVAFLWNTARVDDEDPFSFDRHRFRSGFALSFGTSTFVGPLEVVVTSPDVDGRFELLVNLGHAF